MPRQDDLCGSVVQRGGSRLVSMAKHFIPAAHCVEKPYNDPSGSEQRILKGHE